jgi:hypothetical protein
MDASAVIAKIIGASLLIWTARSIFMHFSQRRLRTVQSPVNGAALRSNASLKDDKKYSLSEHLLNNLLLYLWFAFLVTFSLGMILNN